MWRIADQSWMLRYIDCTMVELRPSTMGTGLKKAPKIPQSYVGRGRCDSGNCKSVEKELLINSGGSSGIVV